MCPLGQYWMRQNHFNLVAAEWFQSGEFKAVMRVLEKIQMRAGLLWSLAALWLWNSTLSLWLCILQTLKFIFSMPLLHLPLLNQNKIWFTAIFMVFLYSARAVVCQSEWTEIYSCVQMPYCSCSFIQVGSLLWIVRYFFFFLTLHTISLVVHQ